MYSNQISHVQTQISHPVPLDQFFNQINQNTLSNAHPSHPDLDYDHYLDFDSTTTPIKLHSNPRQYSEVYT